MISRGIGRESFWNIILEVLVFFGRITSLGGTVFLQFLLKMIDMSEFKILDFIYFSVFFFSLKFNKAFVIFWELRLYFCWTWCMTVDIFVAKFGTLLNNDACNIFVYRNSVQIIIFYHPYETQVNLEVFWSDTIRYRLYYRL